MSKRVLIPRNHNTTVNVYHLPNPDAATDRPLCNRGAGDWYELSKTEAKRRYDADRLCEDCRIKRDPEASYRHVQGPTECEFCGEELPAETHFPTHLPECPAFDHGRGERGKNY